MDFSTQGATGISLDSKLYLSHESVLSKEWKQNPDPLESAYFHLDFLYFLKNYPWILSIILWLIEYIGKDFLG